MFIFLLPAAVASWVGHGIVRTIERVEHIVGRR
jgi:hypothetical protein